MEMIRLSSPRLLQIVFFFLAIYVLLLLLSDGEVNGHTKDHTELPGTQCTNTYPVSHDRESPVWHLNGIIPYVLDKSATKQTCFEYCNKDVRCRSVLHWIASDGDRYCLKYNITVQELKDKGIDIWIQNDTVRYPTYITYDKACDCPAGHEMSTRPAPVSCKPCADGFFKESVGPVNCIKCPNGTVSLQGKTSCGCLPGYEITSDSPYSCEPCKINFYKPNTGKNVCVKCPSERPHTNMTGTINNDSCTNLFCPPGKYQAENKTCVDCPSHTYKEHNDTSKCLNCSSERPHTTKTGTINNDTCTNLFCPPGIGLYGKVCKSCKENEVSSNGTGPCIQPREGEEPNHDQSKFICSAGYGRNKTEDRCQKCQPGYFKSESGDRQCHLCPPNSLPILGAITCEVDRGIQVDVFIGVLLGSMAVLAAVGFAVFLYCRKHRKRPKQSPDTSSEEGESKGNDYSDDYSGESGSSNSPTVALSTSLSDTTVTTYSCTTTSDTKSIKIVSSTFSLRPRERIAVVARNEFFNKKGKENYAKDDENHGDEDRDGNWNEDGEENGNVDKDWDKDRIEGEYENGNVDKDWDKDRIADGDVNGYWNMGESDYKDEDENGYWNMGGNEDNDEDENGYWNMGGNEDKDEDENGYWNVDENGKNIEDKNENGDVDGDDNENDDADWNKEWDDDKDANDSNIPTYETEF